MDPTESIMEKWLIHEATEIYNYFSCMEQETNPRIKEIWTRFLDYELGHMHVACEFFKKIEQRDPQELLQGSLPKMVEFKSQRDFVRKVLANEVDLRTDGANYVDKAEESSASLKYRKQMNSEGVPAEVVSAGYNWQPGTELNTL
jgi:hypothetical protein